MPKPTPGRVVLVLVRPEDNNGHDELPAVITGVNPDGTVNAIGHPDPIGQLSVDLRNVTVVDSRTAALRELEQHVTDLPVRKDEYDQVVRNRPIDAAPWVRVAFWPPRDEPAAAPSSSTSSAAKKSTAAKKAAPAKKTAPAPTAA